jgi:uncharacterized membrane protein (DUF4010 family)
MGVDPSFVYGIAAALGGGLLIGVERERRKGFGADRALAGVRTFTLTCLTGAAAGILAEPLLTFAGALLVAMLAAIGRWRSRVRDPGITTELALFVTYLIGLIAIGRPVVAAGGAVVVAGLLASRRALHEFSVEVLTETELRDGLLFASSALIVLPLLPGTPLSWLAGGSPRRIFALVVTFMGLQAAGYVAQRAVGPRLGLSLSGLVAGFVSSTGTIAALGTRARTDPRLRSACVSGALFSSVATVILLAIVVGAVYAPALTIVGPSLLAALIAALGAAGVSLRMQREHADAHRSAGRPFSLPHALGFAAILAGVTAAMGFVNAHYGHAAAGVAAGIAGLFDVHAAAASTLSLAATAAVSPEAVLIPILIAFSTNTGSKLVGAFVAGGPRYGLPVAGGLCSIAAAAWAPLLWLHR